MSEPLDTDEAMLLVDVAAGKVWQDFNGYDWHERTGTRLRDPLRELTDRQLVELAELQPGETWSETRYRRWRTTLAGETALDEIKATLAGRGYTVDDVRLRRGRLQREGVL